VIDGVTGRIVGRGNCEAFAEALVILAHNAEIRGRFGEAARRHMEEHFSLKQMTEAYLSLVMADSSSVR